MSTIIEMQGQSLNVAGSGSEKYLLRTVIRGLLQCQITFKAGSSSSVS